MKRRAFITLLGGATAWPLVARAQQATGLVIGFLDHGSPEARPHLLAAFRKGLSEIGYVEGQNLAVEFRWAHNQIDRLPELAADLVRRQVAVIATPSSTPAALAAKAATATIPIVFGVGTDPVQIGLVASFNRPGGNITGIGLMNFELVGKRLGLLHDLLPRAASFAALYDPNEGRDAYIKDAETSAATLGREIEFLSASSRRDIDAVFAALTQKRVDGLLIAPQVLFLDRRGQIVGLTLRHALPAIFPWREAVEIGGLMSYSASLPDHYRQVGIYVGRVLKGEKPGDLPIMQASKFELVINLQTAKTIGLEVPATMLASADEVIE
jgi:putative tryptophan/tyrosine transport system substrate-binding protein